MSMKPKQILPEHQAELERISAAQLRASMSTDVSQVLGDINNIINWLSDLRSMIVKEDDNDRSTSRKV